MRRNANPSAVEPSLTGKLPLFDQVLARVALSLFAGRRFRFNRPDRLNIRFGYGVGRDGSTGFRFSFGESL
ncbi:MAG: hypothetical protein H7Z21_05390 [Hymenobacter sp.]|nr:hypothetical protein [Hymenobacter sp.]